MSKMSSIFVLGWLLVTELTFDSPVGTTVVFIGGTSLVRFPTWVMTGVEPWILNWFFWQKAGTPEVSWIPEGSVKKIG